jgi:predicted RNA-binding protein with TRAM domain
MSQPQKNSIDTGMAKENPVEFGKKYQKEINAIMKNNPNVTISKIINAFASGKVKDFDHLNRILNSKK